MRKHLVWFRNDLRVHDHPALSAAGRSDASVIALYILTPATWRYHEAAACKIDFILRNLQILEQELAALGIPLYIENLDSYEATPEGLLGFCAQHQVDAVYLNAQYEIDERRRDQKVATQCQQQGIGYYCFDEQLLITPGTILSNANQPIHQFKAFWRRWLSLADQLSCQEQPFPVQRPPVRALAQVPQSLPGFEVGSHFRLLWPAGERVASQKLNDFLEEKVTDYHETRDFPAKMGTSSLSPYLAQGVISIRRILMRLQQALEVTSFEALIKRPGYASWLNELIWREFYKHRLFLLPKLACSQTMREQIRPWPWHEDQEAFQRWREGQTGFPFIDAGLRQLQQTGWMHNRLRMNVAVFLAKLLRIDWRWGESHFSRNLIDGDLAANNGGWQWCAGIGVDALPYFRIFNPILQSQRFDPEGAFIRQYCPELRHLSAREIHQPRPSAMIDYQRARTEALQIFRLA